MRKIYFFAVFLLLFAACSGNKEKKKPDNNDVSTTSTTSQDAEIKKWLVGKEWTADKGDAPMSVLRIYSMDSCSFAAPRRYGWDFKNGRFVMLAEWPLTKVSDTSFTLFVEPTQKTFTYTFTKTL